MNEGVKEATEILKEIQALGWSGEDRTAELLHALLVCFNDPVKICSCLLSPVMFPQKFLLLCVNARLLREW